MKTKTIITIAGATIITGSWIAAGIKASKQIGIKETIKGAALGVKDAIEDLNNR